MFEKHRVARFLSGALCVAACVAGAGSTTQADLIDIRIDFGDGYSTTPANWNKIGATFLSTVTPSGSEFALHDFHDFAGATDVKLKVTKGFYPSGLAAPAVPWTNPAAPWMDANALSALRDWTMAYTNNPCQLVLTGLDPAELYNLELLAVRASSTTAAKYTVNTLAGEAVFPGIRTGSTSLWDASADGYTAQGFMRWQGISPFPDGTIVVDVDKLDGTYGFLNAMRVTTMVPETGTLLLLATGVLVLAARRKRTLEVRPDHDPKPWSARARTRLHRSARRMVGFLLLGAVCGCGTSDPSGRRAVSGAVTLDGVPLEQGSISFQPTGEGKFSSGAVISNGEYAIPRDKGLPPGKYRVVINAVKPGTGPTLPQGAMPGEEVGVPAEELIPPEWSTNSNHFIEITTTGSPGFTHEILSKKISAR